MDGANDSKTVAAVPLPIAPVKAERSEDASFPVVWQFPAEKPASAHPMDDGIGSAYSNENEPSERRVKNIVTRNNLFLTAGGTGLYVGTPNCQDCDFDSDGYGGYKQFASWNRKHGYKTIADAKSGGLIYKNKGAYAIDPATCFASGLKAPTDRNKEYAIEELDFRLAEKSDAVDKGVVLPNFNDGFKGEAPDLGALEYGEALPHFGPRPKKN